MKYKYKIVGVSEDTGNEEKYTGSVMAESPKEGLLMALALQFGDPAEDTPFNQLSEWSGDLDGLKKQFEDLADNDDLVCINIYGLNLFVSVEEES